MVFVIGLFGVIGMYDIVVYDGFGVVIGRSGVVIGIVIFVVGLIWLLDICLFVCDFKGNDFC